MEDELRFHEEVEGARLADADGMSGDEARAAAQRRRIGDPLRLREAGRANPSTSDDRNVRAGRRARAALMRRDPAFTFHHPRHAYAGIGLNRHFLRRLRRPLAPLPSPSPSPRHRLVGAATKAGVRTFATWAPMTSRRCARASPRSIISRPTPDRRRLADAEPLQLPTMNVSPISSPRWASAPARGRAFLAGAAAQNDDRSAIVSDGLSRRALEADPAIVGRSITVNGLPVHRQRAATDCSSGQ